MSVLIKNMHVPKSCSVCQFRVDNYGLNDFCVAIKSFPDILDDYKGRLPNYPLEDVPLLPNHGKLIDADELIMQIEACDYWVKSENYQMYERGMFTIDIKQMVGLTPAIIEAEVSE